MPGFSKSLSEYYDKWGADIEQRERQQRGRDLQWIEHCLQTEFDLAEARWGELETRFRQILFQVPEEKLPPELDGFSVSGTGLLPKTILYFASLGLLGAEDVRLPAGEMVHGVNVRRGEPLLRALCTSHPKLLPPGARLSDAPYFPEVGELSETKCGLFWQALIETERVRRELDTQEYGFCEDDAMSCDIEIGIDELLYIRDVLRGDGPDRDREGEVRALLEAFESHVKRELG